MNRRLTASSQKLFLRSWLHGRADRRYIYLSEAQLECGRLRLESEVAVCRVHEHRVGYHAIEVMAPLAPFFQCRAREGDRPAAGVVVEVVVHLVVVIAPIAAQE